MPPPPPPDDSPPPPATPGDGWEVVDPAPPVPAHDPILDDPLFAELVEAKAIPELKAEPVAPPRPVAEPLDALPVAEEVPALTAAPVRPPRPRPVAPPPPPPPAEAPRPRVFAACAVIGCFGLGLLAAIGFVAYAAILLLQGLSDHRDEPTPLAGGVRPDPVAPTTLAGTKVINLPGAVDAVGRAAGGRFLLLRTPRTGNVHVFDPNVGEVTRRFEVGGGKALFAGSASKLFVYRPGMTGEELERWDLMSGRKELTEGRPAGVVQPDALVVGAGVDGPVYLVSVPEGGVANVRALDPATLKQKDGGSFSLSGWRGDQKTRVHVRASDDGAVLGVTTPGGAQLVRFAPAPGLVKLAGLAGQSPLLATPAADGRQAFTPLGMYDAVGGRRKVAGTPYTFPPAHGTGLFLSFHRDPVSLTLDDPLRLHLVAHPDLSVELDTLDVPRGLTPTDAGDVPPDQRVHVWPAAGVAVVIKSGGNQQLDVRKVDVRKLLLDEIERPYLLVGSEPHLWALRGREWRYRPVGWTNVDGVPPTVTKVEGPPEMQVRDGELVWTPGAGAPAAGANVTVRLQVEQLTAEQRFRVAVLDDPDAD